MKAAAGKLSTYASIGSVVGIGLGVTLAYRLRQNRVKMFEAFKTARKPTHVKFADGAEGTCCVLSALTLLVLVFAAVTAAYNPGLSETEFPYDGPFRRSYNAHLTICAAEPIPDITPYIAPSTAGDILTYTFFSLGGLFIGGELGLLTGSVSARRRVAQDPQSRARIEKAFRAFRADMLKSEIRTLEGGEGSGGWGLM